MRPVTYAAWLSAVWMGLFMAPARAAADPAALVAGVSQMVASGAPGPVYPMTPEWWSIAGCDADASNPSTGVIAREYGAGRVVVMGKEFTGSYGTLDTGAFLMNMAAWLDPAGRRKVACATGHGETLDAAGLGAYGTALQSSGYTVSSVSGTLTSAKLADVSVLFVSHAWFPFTAAELRAVKSWVSGGGGLCLIGMGWVWMSYGGGKPMDAYPMSQMGAEFGAAFLDGYIGDPTNQLNGTPVFTTFYPTVPPLGVAESLAYIRAQNNARGIQLRPDLEANADFRWRYVTAHVALKLPAATFPEGSPTRLSAWDAFKALLTEYPSQYTRTAVLDQTKYPTSVNLREMHIRGMLDCQPLTAGVRAEVASLAGLSAPYRDLLVNHGVFVMDNNKLDKYQRDFLARFHSLFPAFLARPRGISVRDFLGTPATDVPLGGLGGGVNIFGTRIGGYSENSFPGDVSPGVIDGFSVVVAHEVNHVTDAVTVAGTPAPKAVRDRLIADAGFPALNFLRSMVGDGFFQSAPQEFVASISNQWFTDSEKTLELGLARFRAGRPEPLNQALFFAELYSNGGGWSWFYTCDTAGSLKRQSAPVGRDAQGRITRVTGKRAIYRFTLDLDGRVVSVTTEPPPVTGTAAAALQRWAGLSAGPAGDADGDGRTTLADAVLASRGAAGL